MNALYAGSFDPFTKGHEDVLKQAILLFDKVKLVVCENSSKHAFLTMNERYDSLCKYVLDNSLSDKVEILWLDAGKAVVDISAEHDAQFLIRGIRTVTDFEYELQISSMNKVLNNSVHTIYFTPSSENQFTSSSMAREFIRLKKTQLSFLLPESIINFINNKGYIW